MLPEQIGLFRYLRFDVSMTEKGAVLTSAASECSPFGPLHYIGDEIRDFAQLLRLRTPSAPSHGASTQKVRCKQKVVMISFGVRVSL